MSETFLANHPPVDAPMWMVADCRWPTTGLEVWAVTAQQMPPTYEMRDPHRGLLSRPEAGSTFMFCPMPS